MNKETIDILDTLIMLALQLGGILVVALIGAKFYNHFKWIRRIAK